MSSSTESETATVIQGGPGQLVGTFSNQTANCQGAVFLNGDTSVTLRGQNVPAADLVYEVITAGTLQGSFQSPLALGDLTH